ncbi:phosphodiester glycosidase family protein [Tumebacillus sp. DT12]|uniref:Phosphodiester glycosidase family protein n=1 Tax=Tumebacillus lacus TaxID=2995335 RepID=A0ABT3X259_9BACL|nr:phosphodiester glycosidase family protein [Tumebacillus lacus]MCX7570989.1 phosphodiester glycosidase family protein [Tumebacillus lacus]
MHPLARQSSLFHRQPVLRHMLCWLLALTLIVSGLVPSTSAAGDSPFVTVSEDSFIVAPGVVHTERTLHDGEHVEAVNMMEVDPTDPNIRLEVTSPKGKVIALDTVRNQAAQLGGADQRVVGGFNMDFFNTDPTYAGTPVGLQVSNGELVTGTSVPGRGYLAVFGDGSFKIGSGITLTTALTLADTGETRAFNGGVNKPRTSGATNHLYLYSPRFNATTKSVGTGVEIVLHPTDAKLALGQTLSATVESVSTATNNAIPAGKWAISASGAQASWAQAHLTPGRSVTVRLDLDNGLTAARQIVTGSTTMVQNGQPTAAALNDNVDRHPRTFVAARDGKIAFLTFDGRQPTYSDGVTIAEGARYLAGIGMESAFNVDGGGSTTYAARLPGDTGLSILNSPSDGFERAVSNAMMVVSTAPQGELAHLVPQPKGPVKLIAGGTLPFTVKGQDQHYNGLPVDPAALTWSVDPAVGSVSASGVLTAAAQPGEGTVTVRSGGVTAGVDVAVVDTVARLTLVPSPALVNPGDKQLFTVKGYDAAGQEIVLSPDRVTWSTEGAIGTISPNGELTAVTGTASGKVIAVFGTARAEAVVNIGKPPVMLEDFEDITDLYSSSARANSVSLSLTSRPNPVRYGTHAAKLAYDFTGQAGTSAAYVNIRGTAGLIGRAIEGRPQKFGLWVYGDGKNHWLRGQYEDGNLTKKTIDFTPAGGLNWVGWKYVEATLPSDAVLPLAIRQLYLVETSVANKNSGSIYFDNLRAVYSDTGEDLVGPTFSAYAPAAGQKIYSNQPTISATVRDDGSGVDTGSLKMTLDGHLVAHQYDAATGKVTFTPATALTDGPHTVVLDATDKVGNPALPRGEWTFNVYTGPDTDAPTVSVIAPHDGTTTRTDRPRIAVQATDAYTGIDSGKTTLTVDGETVAHSTDETSGTVWFTPAVKWESGTTHQVTVTVADRNNNPATKTWAFTVGAPLGQPQNADSFQMSVIGDGGYYAAGQGQTAADILLREQIARINQEPSELIGYTGDIVENDTAANYVLGVENMNAFRAPYIVSIGNHEISGTNSRVNYQKTFGEPTYFYDYGNARIIGLDSASGKISNSDPSQWPWLAQTLQDSTEQSHIFLFMHVPPDEVSAEGKDFNTGHGFKDPAEAQRFYDLLGAYKAAHPEKKIVVLSGDLHAYHHKTVQGVEYIISGGGGKYTHIPANEGGYFHYVNLKIDGDDLQWEVVPLLDSIRWTKEAAELRVGESAKLAADGIFQTSLNAPITLPVADPFKTEWITSDPNVATVDSDGEVKAVAPGTVEITLRSGWREAKTQVRVPSVLTSELPSELVLREQNKFSMTAIFHPEDAEKQYHLRISFNDKGQISATDFKSWNETDVEYHKLTFDENGVATAAYTSDFMLKFHEAGVYRYLVEIVAADGTVIASKAESVTVVTKK